MAHRPVLLDQVLNALRLRDDGVYVDATFGGGGYSRAILDEAKCRVIGIDRDPDAAQRGFALAAEHPGFTMRHAPFGDLRRTLDAIGLTAVDGIVFDLGVSSFQLDQSERGFSFQADGPLDMRMAQSGPTAADLVNGLDEGALGSCCTPMATNRRRARSPAPSSRRAVRPPSPPLRRWRRWSHGPKAVDRGRATRRRARFRRCGSR